MMDCAMHTNMTLQTNAAKKPKPDIPVLVWIGGTAARSIFLIILTVANRACRQSSSRKLVVLVRHPR